MKSIVGAASCLLVVACGGEAGSGSVATPQRTLHITVTGRGTVRAGASDCATDCRLPFPSAGAVHLEAVADSGATFAGWSGACSGRGACDLSMNLDAEVGAAFQGGTPTDPPPPANPPSGVRYSVLPLSAIVGPGTQPVAMNARGQIVGNGERGPWVYDSATATLRSVLPPSETRTFVANGISAQGDVALDLVGTDAAGKATHRAFLFASGRLVDLGTLGSAYSTAKVVNSAGLVAGDSQLANGEFRAFLFDGAMKSLGTLGGANDSLAFAINEKGWVTGQAQRADGTRDAFLYDGAMHDLGSLGGAFARGQAVNEKGQVAGMSTLDRGADEPVHAFFHDGKSMKDLGVLPGLPWSSATGLNNQGVVVGNVYAEINGGAGFARDGRRPKAGALEDDYDTHAFVFRDGRMWDLNEVIPPSPFKLFTSLAVDDSGRILCTDGQVGQMPANGYLLLPK
ncbi:MAG: hypothetical protein ACJ79P_05020 [Myxococcales bacterium]